MSGPFGLAASVAAMRYPAGPDHVVRMTAFLQRHSHVAWLRPGMAGVSQQTATWLEVSADPRVDGASVTVSRETLGALVDYLIARLDA